MISGVFPMSLNKHLKEEINVITADRNCSLRYNKHCMMFRLILNNIHKIYAEDKLWKLPQKYSPDKLWVVLLSETPCLLHVLLKVTLKIYLVPVFKKIFRFSSKEKIIKFD